MDRCAGTWNPWHVKRVAIIARLKSGAYEEASKLIAEGPPFEPGEIGLERHSVYLSARDIVFVFEGPDVEWLLSSVADSTVTDPFHWATQAAFDRWRPLIEGRPRIASELYFWERSSAST